MGLPEAQLIHDGLYFVGSAIKDLYWAVMAVAAILAVIAIRMK